MTPKRYRSMTDSAQRDGDTGPKPRRRIEREDAGRVATFRLSDLSHLSEADMRRLVEKLHQDLVDTQSELAREKDRSSEIEKQLRQTRKRLADQMRTARKELSARQQAIEIVYAMATAFNGSLEALIDQVALSVANGLALDFVGVIRIKNAHPILVSQLYEGKLTHPDQSLTDCPLAHRLITNRHAYQVTDDLCVRCPQTANPGIPPVLLSQIGIPLLGRDGTLVGVICGLAGHKRAFVNYERHLMEVFGRYLANEISRAELEERLRRSEELQLLGQLTSGVAHEVRNPLNGIMAMVEALFEELGEDTDFAVYRQHINKQVERLSALMEDLLTLAKPIKEEHKQHVSLHGIIAEAESACRAAHADRKWTVEKVEPDESRQWCVLADSYKLQQVLINLLENAIQHNSNDNSIKIILDQPEDTSIRLRVVDRGNGIPSDTLEHIFEPFFTTRKSGTGLGLSIVRHIVRSHGGAISIYNNTPAPGLTAEIVLPRDQHCPG